MNNTRENDSGQYPGQWLPKAVGANQYYKAMRKKRAAPPVSC